MLRMKLTALSAFCFLAASLLLGCGDDDDGGTEADRLGVGAECAEDVDCLEPAVCLQQFKGGYCGLQDCMANEDCPQASVCVAHGDGKNYCFRACIDKAECNANRSPDQEANCSSNIDFVEQDTSGKACVPPSN
jgi:hypothetical protein